MADIKSELKALESLISRALDGAESFITGFEDDDCQEPGSVELVLNDLDAAKTSLNEYIARESARLLHSIQPSVSEKMSKVKVVLQEAARTISYFHEDDPSPVQWLLDEIGKAVDIVDAPQIRRLTYGEQEILSPDFIKAILDILFAIENPDVVPIYKFDVDTVIHSMRKAQPFFDKGIRDKIDRLLNV